MYDNIKTTIEVKDGKITFTCEPSTEVVVKCGNRIQKMKRSEAIKFFWNEIAMGDNLEVEQGAYGLFDTLAGKRNVETEF